MYKLPIYRDREGTVFTDDKTGRVTASFEEMALYSTILTEALSELLVEKGLLDRAEFKLRIEKIKKEISLQSRRPQ